MATITTTTVATPLIWPSTTLIDRDPTTGYLYVLVRASTADTFEVWRSINNGGAWTLLISTVRANVSEVGSIFVHSEGWIYWTYRTNESSQDRVYFRRGNLAAPSWQAELLVANPANGVHIGGMDIAVVRTPAQGHYIALAVAVTIGAQHGLLLYGVYINPNDGVPAINNGIITGTRQWLVTASGRIGPSIDIEHSGNAHGADVPNLWAAFGRTSVSVVKLAWTGAGWTGPTQSGVLSTAALSAQDAMPARWDGSRFLVAVPNPAATSTVVVYERNRAHNTTTVRTTPVHTTGVVVNCSLSYNSVTGDIRVYAVGTSTQVLYYTDYVRATGIWSAWAVVTATAVLGATGNNYSVRRSSFGNAKYDVLTAHTGAPNTIVHTAQSLTYAPSAPTWDTATMGRTSGSAADVATTLVLDWNFVDPDPADTQGSYAVSRQIGAGALNYWRASDSTWQVAEVQNTSATTALTLPVAWGVHTDAATTFRAKTWDAAGVASVYGDSFVVIPSQKVNPTITAPAAAAVLTTDTVTATWTVSEETAIRLTLATNPGGVVAYDSMWTTTTVLAATIPVRLPDLSGWTLTLQTRNNEGLASTIQTVNFTIDYTEPAAPVLTTAPSPGQGVIVVTAINAAVVGTQPAIVDQDLYRRPVLAPNIMSNGTFEALGMTGWTNTGCTAAQSATQAHSGTYSAFITPDGVTASPRLEQNTMLVPVVEGQSVLVDGWIRPTTANKSLRIGLNFFQAGGAFLSTQVLFAPPIAGAWLYVQYAIAAPTLAATAGVTIGLTGTPAAGDTAYIDDVRVRYTDASTGVRVAAGMLSGAAFLDWGPIHGVAYEYRLIARGANGTSIAGPWMG